MIEHIDPGMRFAIYTRYSSDMQNDISLEAQEFSCRQAIEERGGIVIDVFSDGAKSGWSLDRDGFNALRKAAEKGKFDAIMFWKFDRLARSHEDITIIKLLLRRDYELKLFCVEGFSEDDDDSLYSAMMERMLEVFSAYYSKNVSHDTKRGKKQRAMNGNFNGSVAPLGYVLVKKNDATHIVPAGLHIKPDEAAIVRNAFMLYATGDYSELDIAEWMNTQPLIKEMRQGKKPVGKETVRDILQNRVYVGEVPYAETIYTESFGKSKKSNRKRRTWYEGKHEAIITDSIYKQCEMIREEHRPAERDELATRTYLFNDRVYCVKCLLNKSDDISDNNYAKMRPSWVLAHNTGYYRCLATHRGYDKCGQKQIDVDYVNTDVIKALSNLTIPESQRNHVEQAIQNLILEGRARDRIEEIRKMTQRVDTRYDEGYFVSEKDYITEREQLKREFDALESVEKNETLEAADLLDNFAQHWAMCGTLENSHEMRQHLLQKIVNKVYVHNKIVVAIELQGEYTVILTHDNKILRALRR